MNLLVAAHPDDEWLGASRLILTGKIDAVLFVVPRAFDADRLAEARALAAICGHQVWDMREPMTHTGWRQVERVFVPASSDRHHDHQAALTWAVQQFQPDLLWEYSIEKYAPYLDTLNAEELAYKRSVFASTFPSQVSELTDPKYFLFEGRAPLGVPSITVCAAEVGFHSWPGAPEEVSFLRHTHRHVFHAALTLRDLYRSDRQFEFFITQEWLRAELRDVLRAPRSCEDYARRLAIAARALYQVPVTVSVSEDGENSAEVSL
jgi:hypothetical protein